MNDPEPDSVPRAPSPTPRSIQRYPLVAGHPKRRIHQLLASWLHLNAPKKRKSKSRHRIRDESQQHSLFLPAQDLEHLTVAELMRPAHEMVYLSSAQTPQSNLELIERTRFSRYPLFADDGETLLGMVHFKDIFPTSPHGVDFSTIARKALIVPPDTLVPDLFQRFRQGGSHFALVGYPGEHPEGFLTIDNLLGAMVGEIRDEFRRDGGNWHRQDDGTLLGKGSMSLFSLKRALGIELPELSVDSVGGLIMERLGRLPKEGERIAFEHFDLVIKRMQGPRIQLLKVIAPRSTEDGAREIHV